MPLPAGSNSAVVTGKSYQCPNTMDVDFSLLQQARAGVQQVAFHEAIQGPRLPPPVWGTSESLASSWQTGGGN